MSIMQIGSVRQPPDAAQILEARVALCEGPEPFTPSNGAGRANSRTFHPRHDERADASQLSFSSRPWTISA